MFTPYKPTIVLSDVKSPQIQIFVAQVTLLIAGNLVAPTLNDLNASLKWMGLLMISWWVSGPGTSILRKQLKKAVK